MKKETLIKTGIWALIILVALFLLQIALSVAKSIKKPTAVVFNVNSIKIASQVVPHIMTVQGLVEGDPQVKVYPQISGKFARNNVVEGQMVGRDSIIAYIDRDVIGATYELAPVKAPVAGMVTKLYYLDKGESASPQQPVAEIANEDSIKVVFNLGQADLLKIKKGQKVKISYISDPAISMDGEVVSVPPVVDSDIMAGTVVVKAVNKGKTMKIGMSVNVNILYDQPEVFMVPEKAVLLSDETAYVYVNHGGKVQMVTVNIDYRVNDKIEIKGALNEGDEIITEGNFKLYDGAMVDTTPPEAKKAK